jgi:predicted transcriptional regulator
MKHSITYALDLDVVREIQRLATVEDRSRSNVANRLLRAALTTTCPNFGSDGGEIAA